MEDLLPNYNFLQTLDENGMSPPQPHAFAEPPRSEKQVAFGAPSPSKPGEKRQRIPHRALNPPPQPQRVINVDLRKMVSAKAPGSSGSLAETSIASKKGVPFNRNAMLSAKPPKTIDISEFQPTSVCFNDKAKTQLEMLKREMEESLRASNNSFKLNMKRLIV